MPQPSISGMEPTFGDAFQNYTFADQALTSTDLLASSSDPDFMYELDRDMSHRQSPHGDSMVGAMDVGKDADGWEGVTGLGDCETAYGGTAFEQWDSYWEDLTRYTRLTSCDIWGTKEVDFLGLDDFSSPYQDEEVIARTPTLAQLNSEDSQPVCETLYHPTELPPPLLPPQSQPPKRLPGFGLVGPTRPSPIPPPPPPPSASLPSRSPLADFPEGSQKATWPVPSSTDTVAKAQNQPSQQDHRAQTQPFKARVLGHKMAPPYSHHGSNFVRKAKVRVSAGGHRAPIDAAPARPEAGEDPATGSSPLPLLSQAHVASTSGGGTLVVTPGTAAAAAACSSGRVPVGYERRAGGEETRRDTASAGRSAVIMPQLVAASHAATAEGAAGGLVSVGVSLPGASGGVLVVEGSTSEKSKEEEHNYSLFLSRAAARQAGRTHSPLEEAEEEEEEEEDEEEDEDEEDGEEEEEEEADVEDLELDEDEDHDEGFGSEHELSENEEEKEEEEEEEEDYEADKDDDMSDTFSEQGCDMELMEDIKGLTAGVSKRGKRRYFWEYSEQLTPSKQERMLKPSEWDKHTLPSNLFQKNGPLHGKYMLKKSRRTDVEDLTPNPRKLLQIGTELRKLNKVISDLTPVSELPLTARPRSRKEKNKLASRACRLKKKAQYEANKVKLWGLSTEYDRLLFVINAIKEEIVTRVKDSSPQSSNMADSLDRLIQETLVTPPVAGQTSDFVNQILETTGRGDPTGGLVGLRVPTSRI